MNLGSFIAKSAWRNPRRTVLTVTSIAISLAMIMVLRSILVMFFDPTNGTADAVPRIIARHRVSLSLSLPVNYEPKIRKVDGVQELTPMNWFAGIYKDDKMENFFARFATDIEAFPKVYTEFEYTGLDAVIAQRSACMVGEDLMKRYAWKTGDRITITGDIYPVDLELTIAGTFKPKVDGVPADFVVFHKKYLDELMGETVRAGSYFILLRSADDVSRVCAEIEDLFRNSDAEVRAETEKAFQLSFVEMLGNIKLLFSSLISVVVFSILLIAASTMAMAIRERTREIAVLKTIGFSRAAVTAMVVAEGVLVSVAGGVLGVGGVWFVLPRPPLFLALGGALAVMAVVGLPLLLLAILLPEETADGTKGQLRKIVTAVGPWISVVLGLIAGVAIWASSQGMDWFKLSKGSIPALFVRPETLWFGAAIALVIGLGSSAIPAWNAARLRVLDGLRTIG